MSVDHQKSSDNPSSKRASNPKQLDQFYELYSNIQNQSQSSTNVSSALLAHKGNYINAIIITSKPKSLDSCTSDHMTNVYHLYSYLPCAGNFKARIVNGSLSSVASKGSTRISNLIVFKSILHVPKLSCNLISINQLTRDSHCSAKFVPSHCLSGTFTEKDN